MNHRAGQRGVVLIMALFVIILLAVIVAQFQFSMKIERRIAQYRADSLAASYTLKSAVALARLAIIADMPVPAPAPGPQPGAETAPDKSPLAPPGLLSLEISLSDAAGRLNINKLVRADGTPDPDLQQAIENLLAGLGADPGLAEAIIACIDPDDTGAHEDPACLNRPFQNITELALVPGMDAETLRPPDDGTGTARPGLWDLLTVHGRGVINVNTACPAVLHALLSNPVYATVIPAIVEQRREKPYESLAELFQTPGTAPGMFGAFEKQFVFKSTTHIASLTAREGRVVRRATAVFERSGADAVLLFYLEE